MRQLERLAGLDKDLGLLGAQGVFRAVGDEAPKGLGFGGSHLRKTVSFELS